MPETLHALIAARLDGFGPEERRILQDGAVLGKTFTRAALAALSRLEGEQLDDLLSGLVRKEVLSVQADPRSPEHGQYGFLQDLVRHVAYETLSRRERHTRHLDAAAHLTAALGEDEVAEVVASHLVDAFRTAPDEATAAELKVVARDAVVRAAERAQSLAASAEAQRYFEQAAELTDDAGRRNELVDRAGQVAWRAGRAVEARALLERAHTAYMADGQVRPAARVSARLGEIDWNEGHPQAAVDRISAALEAMGGEPDEDFAVVVGQLGRFLVLTDQIERGAVHVEQALELAERLDLPEALVNALNSKAALALRRDRPTEARILLEGALGLAHEHELHTAALRSYNNLLVTLDHLDRIPEQLELTDEAIALARRVGDGLWDGLLTSGWMTSLALVGRWDEAVAANAAAGEAATVAEAGNRLDLVAVLCERGEVAAARELYRQLAAEPTEESYGLAGRALFEARLLRAEGAQQAALDRAESAVGASEDIGTTSFFFKAALAEALETSLALGDLQRARELLDMVDALQPGQRTPVLRAHRARFGARLAALTGEGDPESGFAVAAAAYESLGLPFQCAVTRLEHGEWLAAQGRPEEAAELLDLARETFDHLRARPWIERADRARPVEALPA